MLIFFLFVLSTAAVNGESVDEDGLRIPRQLKLGLQNINNADEEFLTTVQQPLDSKDDFTKGYLPPVSSSLSPEYVTSQSQQAFDFKSANSVEKESELCKPPFDHESCTFKDNSTSDSEVPKPSRDLIPPVNDLEQELATKPPATTTTQQVAEEIKTTTETQNIFTTTEKPTTKILIKPVSTQKPAKITTTTSRPKPIPNRAEATNEQRSYLPPQPDFSAAAQTNVAVVQPANQNHNDHHHHGHHHGDNFNICADAFHSFLCAPLKARKRITGALPAGLKAQSSFINYQKTLNNFYRGAAPSDSFRNEPFPPNASPSNLIQSTYLPPFTTKRPVVTTTTTRSYSAPKFISEPSSSNDRFYLSPAINNVLSNSSFVRPTFSNQAYTTKELSTTPTQVSLTKTTSAVSNSLFQEVPGAQEKSKPLLPAVPVFNSLSSNENRFYLPPKSNPQPSASFVSTSKSILPITTTLSPLPSSSKSLPPLVFSPVPTKPIFTPQKPKVQPTLPVFTTSPTSFTATSAFVATSKPSTRVPSLPSTKPLFPSQPFIPSGSYLSPVSEFQASSSFSTTSTRPFLIMEKPSNSEKLYLPPDLKEPAAAQIASTAVAAPQVNNPFHHGRDLCTDPFHSFLCVNAKPRKRITGQLPSGFEPESTNTNELKLKPEPSNQDENKIHLDKSLEGASAQDSGYRYPKPINPLPTPSSPVTSTIATSTGYSYPKPEKKFPLPTQQDVKLTPAATSTAKKTEPVFRPSEAKVVSGYQYPKPDKFFPLPAAQENNKVITTTSSPSTGYSYPKPQKPFPLPTEQKEIRQNPKQNQPTTTTQPSTPLPTNQVKGYQYNKPEESLKLPEKKRYYYPRPEKRLELPTEGQSKFLSPQNSFSSDGLGSLKSAEFIPVNKIDFKRSESSKLVSGLRRFGERMKKRERQAQLLKRQAQSYSIQ